MKKMLYFMLGAGLSFYLTRDYFARQLAQEMEIMNLYTELIEYIADGISDDSISAEEFQQAIEDREHIINMAHNM